MFCSSLYFPFLPFCSITRLNDCNGTSRSWCYLARIEEQNILIAFYTTSGRKWARMMPLKHYLLKKQKALVSTALMCHSWWLGVIISSPTKIAAASIFFKKRAGILNTPPKYKQHDYRATSSPANVPLNDYGNCAWAPMCCSTYPMNCTGV